MLRFGYRGHREEFSMLALRPHQIQHMEHRLTKLVGGGGLMTQVRNRDKEMKGHALEDRWWGPDE